MLGWIGNVFIVIGLWGIGSKWRPAFLFSVAGESFWIVHSVNQEMWDLAAICVVFLMMALRGWVKWGESGNN